MSKQQQGNVGQAQGGSNPQPAPPEFRSNLYGPSQQTAAYPGDTCNTSTPGPSTTVVPDTVAAPVYQQFYGMKKSIVDAYLLWLLFGMVGGHHFYLRVRIYLFIQH